MWTRNKVISEIRNNKNFITIIEEGKSFRYGAEVHAVEENL